MKSIRKAFEIASKKAEIENLRLHDFRHTAITRWAVQGIPQSIIMAAAGHHSIQQNNDYTNVKESHIKQAFSVVTTLLHVADVEKVSSASY